MALALAAAAAAAERWLRLKGRQIRWAWVGAMVLSVGLPAARLAAPFVGGLPTPEVLNREEVRASLRAHHPEALRRQGVGGEVLVIVHIGADGRVTGGFLSGGSGHAALDRAALEVVQEIRYAPARREGEPLAVWMSQPLRFPPE